MATDNHHSNTVCNAADSLQRRITLRNFVEAVPLALKTRGFDPTFKQAKLGVDQLEFKIVRDPRKDIVTILLQQLRGVV